MQAPQTTTPAASQDNEHVTHFTKDAVLCLSLANLFLLHVLFWLTGNHPAIFRKTVVDSAMLLRVLATNLIATGIVAAGCWLVLSILRRYRSRTSELIGTAGILFVLLIAANTYRIRTGFMFQGNPFAPQILIPLVVAALLALFVVIRWTSAFRRGVVAVAMSLSPLVLITTLSTLWRAYKTPAVPAETMADGPVAPFVRPPGRAPGHRIVWMIFDEMDQVLLFPKRPAGLSLPEFDGLRSRSLYADAQRPAADTLEAIPSLFFGRAVAKVRDDAFPDLPARFRDTDSVQSLREPPTVFSEAGSLDWNTAIDGWYLPYCRFFNQQVNYCAWEPAASVTEPDPASDVSLAGAADLIRKVVQLCAVRHESRRDRADLGRI
jgi:hypothetical protein